MNTQEGQVKIALFVFLVIHAIALFAFPLLPFIDLPNHLAESAIFKYHDEPGNAFAQYYQPVPWYFPNTFHTVFCSLFPDVEFGNKVFHILCVLLLAVSVFLIIKKLGGNLWYGLLALLFTYNYNLTYGFVGFAISIPMLLFLFYLILLDVEHERAWIKLAISALLVLLFWMHAQNALLGLLLYGLMMLYVFRKSFGKLLLHAFIVPVPLVVLIVVWWIVRDKQNESSTLDYLVNYYKSSYFAGFPVRFRIVVFDNFQLREGTTGVVIAATLFACVFIPLFWFKAWKNISRVYLSQCNLLALFFLLVVLGCYFLLPDKLPGQIPLFQRLCTIAILAFIICASVLLKNGNTVALKYFVATVVLVYSLFWIEYLYSFNRLNASFNPGLFAGISNHARMAGLIYQNKYRGRRVYIHYPNYFVVWNQGVAASKFIDYRFGVVRRVAAESGLPLYDELIGEGHHALDLTGVDYLLVRGKAPVQPDVNLKGFSPTKEAGNWELYGNDLMLKGE